MNITLSRFGSIPDIGTFGQLAIGGHTFYTVEQPWRPVQEPGGMPSHSCVPAGIYVLDPHDSQHHPNCWALVNHDLGVSHYPEPGCTRSACLIHKANWPIDVKGCIGPGKTLAHINGMLGVSNSAWTMGEIRRLLNSGDNHTLTIKWLCHEGEE